MAENPIASAINNFVLVPNESGSARDRFGRDATYLGLRSESDKAPAIFRSSLFRGRGKNSLGFWILKCRPKQIGGCIVVAIAISESEVRFGSKADIDRRQLDVRFVPKADSCTAAIVTTAIAGMPGGSPPVAQRSPEA